MASIVIPRIMVLGITSDTQIQEDAVLHSMHVGLHRRSTVHCMCTEHKDKTPALVIRYRTRRGVTQMTILVIPRIMM